VAAIGEAGLVAPAHHRSSRSLPSSRSSRCRRARHILTPTGAAGHRYPNRDPRPQVARGARPWPLLPTSHLPPGCHTRAETERRRMARPWGLTPSGAPPGGRLDAMGHQRFANRVGRRSAEEAAVVLAVAGLVGAARRATPAVYRDHPGVFHRPVKVGRQKILGRARRLSRPRRHAATGPRSAEPVRRVGAGGHHVDP